MRRRLTQILSRLGPDFWVPLDLAGAAGAVAFAHTLSPFPFPGWPRVAPVAATFVLALLVAGPALGLYDAEVPARRGLIVRRGLGSAAGALALTLGVFYAVLYRPIGRWISAWTLALAAAWLCLPRLLAWSALSRRPRRVLFAGRTPLMAFTRACLERDLRHLYRVVEDAPGGADLAALVQRHDVDEVVLPHDAAELRGALPAALSALALGCHVRSEADFHEHALRTVPVALVSPDWLLGRGLDTSNHVYETAKRLLDLALAALALLLALPLLAAAALLVRLDGGPALFRQTRVGRHGVCFEMLKLRTMTVGAEDGGPRWAAPADERCTPVGRVLRRLRLDELPQLVNVLRGEMSFVGPRPERPEFVALLEREVPYYAWRHVLRPGLTGWAQINFPYGSSVADSQRKLEFDLYYVRHGSLLFDLVIALRTLTTAVRTAR